MHLLPERPIVWKLVGGWATAQARRTTHGRVHAFTAGGRFTSAWWSLNPGGWRRWSQAERRRPLMRFEGGWDGKGDLGGGTVPITELKRASLQKG